MSYIYWISNKIPSFTSSFVCWHQEWRKLFQFFGHDWMDADPLNNESTISKSSIIGIAQWFPKLEALICYLFLSRKCSAGQR